MISPRPHDLLLLSEIGDLGDAPPWVRAALWEAPWVVVRRAAAPPHQVAAGVRGYQRSQRFPTIVPCRHIQTVATPESLAEVALADGRVPALAALPGIRTVLRDLGLPWGPTGSVGFELATGIRVATDESDVDVLMRVHNPTGSVVERLVAAHRALQHLPVRVDCQVELPRGAVALAEIVSGRNPVMVRTQAGPCLVDVSELF